MQTASFRRLLGSLGMVSSLLPSAAAAGLSYEPLRPPAIPLAVRNPYTSAWLSTSVNGEARMSQSPTFWTMSEVGWEGLIAVDNVVYEYLGDSSSPSNGANFTLAAPLDVQFDSQSSNITFQAGPVTLEVSFLSPVTPKDLCRTSIPLSYMTATARSNDGKPHDIRFYSDVSSTWLGGEAGDPIVVLPQTHNTTPTQDTLFTWTFNRASEVLFGESKDLPLWGNVSFTTSPMLGQLSMGFGEPGEIRNVFAQNKPLQNEDPATIGQPPVLAFSHQFGNVNEATVRYTVGTVQDPIIQLNIANQGPKALSPWWLKCYGSADAMINFHWHDYDQVKMLGDKFETQLKADIDKFYEGKEKPVSSNSSAPAPNPIPTNGTDPYGRPFVYDSTSDSGFLDPANWTGVGVPFLSEAQSYYSIVALSARQTMGGYVFAVDPDPSRLDPLVFLKEISSDGNVNTVDVLYPAAPFSLYANPNMLRYALQSLFDYQEAKTYTDSFCIHDIGRNFPNATGHFTDQAEYMPVEESANFIIMTYAYYKFTGDAGWLTPRYDLLARFASYLVNNTLIPAAQLSTDDFAGALLNQTNLAIKGIVALKAMSHIASVAKKTAEASDYADKAKSYYSQWETLAIDPSHKHTTLAYDWRSSWGLLYNIYFDKLLNLGLVDEKLYTMQSDWYPTVSQLFGVPLDSRHAYGKTDWQIWTAATSHADTRRLFINSIAYWLNEGTTNGPFTDLYQCTGTGSYVDGDFFMARPVAGGHFALLALGTTGQMASADGGDTSGCLFPKDSPQPLPLMPGPSPGQLNKPGHA
ncbi:DUF1793-domain-containing protein [Xylaria nigripes]|nr:DUF1793-domain-containing protein [Xylaria nigripes]